VLYYRVLNNVFYLSILKVIIKENTVEHIFEKSHSLVGDQPHDGPAIPNL